MADVVVMDVVVIGGGPAGIAAATTAAEQGLSVTLIDEAPRPGGQIWRHVTRHSLPGDAKQWLHRLEKCGARVRSGLAVIDVMCINDVFVVHVAGIQNAAGWAAPGSVSARALIIAAGARERFIPFPGWTLPGVVGVGGGQALVKAGASVRGRRVIIAGSGPLLLPVAAALTDAGATVSHILEQASRAKVLRFAAGLWRTPSKLVQAARYRATSPASKYLQGTWITEAHGTERVRSVTMRNARRSWTEPCDILCTGYGLVPSAEIAHLIGCSIDSGAVVVDDAQRSSVPGVYCAGESTGIGGVDAALAEGIAAAYGARSHVLGGAVTQAARRASRYVSAQRAFAARMDIAFQLRPELRQLATPDTIVCRCEDVRLGSIARCESMREAKLHTRAGMGACQGRVCAPALELLFNWSEASVRPPLVPAPVSAFLDDTPAAAGGVL